MTDRVLSLCISVLCGLSPGGTELWVHVLWTLWFPQPLLFHRMDNHWTGSKTWDWQAQCLNISVLSLQSKLEYVVCSSHSPVHLGYMPRFGHLLLLGSQTKGPVEQVVTCPDNRLQNSLQPAATTNSHKREASKLTVALKWTTDPLLAPPSAYIQHYPVRWEAEETPASFLLDGAGDWAQYLSMLAKMFGYWVIPLVQWWKTSSKPWHYTVLPEHCEYFTWKTIGD
jgi:hypothetical protein